MLVKISGIFICFMWSAYAVSLNIKACHNKDFKCIKESAQDLYPKLISGVPELGIDKTDPMFIKKVDLSNGNLKFTMKDITIVGIKKCKIDKMERVGLNIKSKGHCDVTIDGEYDMDGQLLVVPVRGKGKAHFVLKNIVLAIDAELQFVERNGKKHWDIKNWKHTYDVKDKSEFDFENMFSGNEVLARASKDVFNTHWKLFTKEMGPPLMKAILDHLAKNTKKLFQAISVDEMILS